MPGDSSVWINGDIMFVESTADEQLVLTGIVAPSDTAFCTVTNGGELGSNIAVLFEDEANVVGDYGADAESDAGNRINGGGSNVAASANNFLPLVYESAEWRALTGIAS